MINQNLYIIKIGGNVIDDPAKLGTVLDHFAGLQGKKILVHGGGKLATGLAKKLGVEQQLVDGRRITDAETLRIVTMVYAGYINKNIVARLQALGCNALGLTGADGNLLEAGQRKHPTTDYGYVGDVLPDRFSIPRWTRLLEHHTLVMAPLTHDCRGQLLNTNADTIAQEIARGLSGYYDVHLIYSFEKNGVLLDVSDEHSVIPRIDPAYYAALKEKGLIFAGMLPKLDNAFEALKHGAKRVIIGKAEELDELIKGNAGTTIANE